MIHLQQYLAHYWHLSPTQYWQLRVLCTLMIGPLLGVVCLLLFRRRQEFSTGMKHRLQARPVARLPLPPTV